MRTLFGLLGCAVLMAGCSQVPKPAAYPMTYQQKMQSARHWEVLARSVVAQVSADYGNVSGNGVYVEPMSGVFGEAFSTLLTTELVNARVPLAASPQGAAVLSTDVQLIKHRAKWPDRQNRRHIGFWTGVATVIRLADNMTRNMIIPAGVAIDLTDGTWVTLPAHEVLITTSLEKDGVYAMRRSNVFYVNDADSGQYMERLPGSGSARMLEVVAR